MDENINYTPTPGAAPTPTPEAAPVTPPIYNAAPTTGPVNSTAPTAGPVNTPPTYNVPAVTPKKPPLKLILIAAVAAIVVICIVVSLISRGNPTSVAERYIKATVTDLKTAVSLCAYDFKEYRLSSYDGDEEAFFEDMSDQFDADVSSWNDFYKAFDTNTAEGLEDEYGKYKITVEATKTKDVSVRSVLEDYEWLIENLESSTDFDSDKISDAKLVTVKTKIVGEDDMERSKLEVCMVKIGGSWRVLSFNSVD